MLDNIPLIHKTFFTLLSLSFSDWISENDVSLSSQILSFAYFILLVMLSIASFISFIVLFSSRIFLLGYFLMICISLLSFLFCLCIVFLISLNYLSLFSCSSLSFLKAMTLNYLLHTSQISITLGLLTGKLLWSFGGVMFPGFFMLLEILHCCLHIWRRSYLLQSLLPGFGRVVPSISSVRDSLTLSDIFYWLHLFYTSCILLVVQEVYALVQLCAFFQSCRDNHSTDSFPFASPREG